MSQHLSEHHPVPRCRVTNRAGRRVLPFADRIKISVRTRSAPHTPAASPLPEGRELGPGYKPATVSFPSSSPKPSHSPGTACSPGSSVCPATWHHLLLCRRGQGGIHTFCLASHLSDALRRSQFNTYFFLK